MYILYLDESGIHAAATHFVLAGLAVFEREIHWYSEDMDALQRRYLPNATEPAEFHVSKLRAPKGSVPQPFDTLTPEQLRQLTTDIYQVIRGRRGILFGAAIEKAWCTKEEPYERAFEDLTSRFDLLLRRLNAKAGAQDREEQRGLIVVAESSYKHQLEVLGRRFRGGATRWGQLRAIADVPFFAPGGNTRLLQLADFCANAIYGRYHSGHARDFDVIAPKFDRDAGRIHGLVHLCRDAQCQCLACVSKEQARTAESSL